MEYYLAVRIGRLGRPGITADGQERVQPRPAVRAYGQSTASAAAVRAGQSPSARPLARPDRPGRY
jgi:hypothetical protein